MRDRHFMDADLAPLFLGGPCGSGPPGSGQVPLSDERRVFSPSNGPRSRGCLLRVESLGGAHLGIRQGPSQGSSNQTREFVPIQNLFSSFVFRTRGTPR